MDKMSHILSRHGITYEKTGKKTCGYVYKWPELKLQNLRPDPKEKTLHPPTQHGLWESKNFAGGGRVASEGGKCKKPQQSYPRGKAGGVRGSAGLAEGLTDQLTNIQKQTVNPTNLAHYLKGDPTKSLLLLRIYYNHNHTESQLQFVQTYYSFDTPHERAHPDGRPISRLNGYIYMMRMLENLKVKGTLWCAIFCHNHKVDELGKPLELMTYWPDPKPVKNFNSHPAAYRDVVVGKL